MQKRHVIATVCGALTLGAAVQPAAAHHSFAAEFDANQPVTLHGTITRMEWINPHTWMHVDVINEDGTTTAWNFVSAMTQYVTDKAYLNTRAEKTLEIIEHVAGDLLTLGAERTN